MATTAEQQIEKDLERRERELAEREAQLNAREAQLGDTDEDGKPRVNHRKGCPSAPGGEREQEGEKPRLEIVEGMKPAQPDKGLPAEPTKLRRCIDCGNYVGLEGDVRENA